jgi:hypothetical protein
MDREAVEEQPPARTRPGPREGLGGGTSAIRMDAQSDWQRNPA